MVSPQVLLGLLLSLAPALAQTAAPPPAAANSRDAQLIANAEKAYKAGLASSQAGQAEAARANFDYAVDSLLSSGVDLKTDATLAAELDRIVDLVNALELDALKQGAEQTAGEPTPVDLANDVTFPADPNVKAQAEAELKTTQSDLPLVINDPVASFINFFSNTPRGRATIVLSLQRAGRYRDMIARVLKEEGLPQDLIYQAVAESGFRPTVVNGRSGAAGMWQFMPFGTYGLARTGWYDERFDPEKATRAYAREIKKNYKQFGDWYLAMAGYNWGPGNVQRAVQRTGYADFWELYRRNNLPAETKNYVPITLAVAIMAKNPKQYGLADLTPDAAIAPDTVTTNYSVSLALAADLTGGSESTLEELNPSLLRHRTPPDESYELHLPAGTRELFTQRVAVIPEEKRATWRYHQLQGGETADEVARTYHVPVEDLLFANQLSAGADLAGVQALVIPEAPARVVESGAGAGYGATRASVYKVRRGDTLVTVADQFGVTVSELRAWNHLGRAGLAAGRRLHVAEPARVASTARGGARGRLVRASVRGGAPMRSGRLARRSAAAPVRRGSAGRAGAVRAAHKRR
jgi:membrane-bound lytic murein transglycosylase D